jgi:hypothetical protein
MRRRGGTVADRVESPQVVNDFRQTASEVVAVEFKGETSSEIGILLDVAGRVFLAGIFVLAGPNVTILGAFAGEEIIQARLSRVRPALARILHCRSRTLLLKL